MQQLLEIDLEIYGEVSPPAQANVHGAIQNDDNLMPTSNLDDVGDSTRAELYPPHQLLPIVHQPKSYEIGRHRTHHPLLPPLILPQPTLKLMPMILP